MDKEQRKCYIKNYYAENKTTIINRHNNYVKNNKAKVAGQKLKYNVCEVLCSCGIFVRNGSKFNHLKSRKHFDNLPEQKLEQKAKRLEIVKENLKIVNRCVCGLEVANEDKILHLKSRYHLENKNIQLYHSMAIRAASMQHFYSDTYSYGNVPNQ